ncbi:hypothetical protein BDV38DRAFT_252146 [Aspergillus pseudotamarii]|uniref:Uncharacterized protein n=1 Tax=Aspergillus pseudotamarii TaxID=132259 RepID=A0A5N6SLW7_ASPPS|nr:uncharacterized protein BDV38DRAFT_252146 [Aspergillus pseudotamarii]KAE8135555.1 hypothetical protein BDV38DRAFT_252146 [Aspergillus pseudotamarii]
MAPDQMDKGFGMLSFHWQCSRWTSPPVTKIIIIIRGFTIKKRKRSNRRGSESVARV